MTTTRALPKNLFSAYEWVSAAGELEELAKMSETSAETYASEAVANAVAHDVEDVDEGDIVALWSWLRGE